MFKPHSGFLVASDVPYSKTVAQGSNVSYPGHRPEAGKVCVLSSVVGIDGFRYFGPIREKWVTRGCVAPQIPPSLHRRITHLTYDAKWAISWRFPDAHHPCHRRRRFECCQRDSCHRTQVCGSDHLLTREAGIDAGCIPAENSKWHTSPQGAWRHAKGDLRISSSTARGLCTPFLIPEGERPFPSESSPLPLSSGS